MGRILGDLNNARDSFVQRPSTVAAESDRAAGFDYGLELSRDVRNSPQRLAHMRTTVDRFPSKRAPKRCATGGDYVTQRSASGHWLTFQDQVRAPRALARAAPLSLLLLHHGSFPSIARRRYDARRAVLGLCRRSQSRGARVYCARV